MHFLSLKLGSSTGGIISFSWLDQDDRCFPAVTSCLLIQMIIRVFLL